MKEHVGHGVFGWSSTERRSNRYGAIHLCNAPYGKPPCANTFHNTEALQRLEGQRVRITCKVVETRESSHAGDAFLGITPIRPDVDEVVDLGVGTLRLEPGYDGMIDIVLEPEEDREDLWIDPRKLYRLHDQTVDIFIEVTTDDFTPMADLKASEDGVIDNGDGTLQVKRVGEAILILPAEVTPLGEGMFMLDFGPSQKGRRVKFSKE